MAEILSKSLSIAASVVQSIRIWFILVLASLLVVTCIELLQLPITNHAMWETLYPLVTSLLSGGVISFLFYFLVVHLPAEKKKAVVKGNLVKLYAGIKKDILIQVIFASQQGGRKDLVADSDTIARLMTRDGFRAAFDGGREGHEGFYAFRNRIDQDVPEFREIVWNLKVLAKHIDFLLHHYSVTDTRKFDFFKRLEIFLLGIEHSGPGYDEGRALSTFIQEIFAHRNFAEGNVEYDIVEKMISEL